MSRKTAQIPHLLFFCLMVLTSIASVRADQDTIRVGLFNMPPFYSQGPTGQPEGELIETLNEVMDYLGYSWQPKFMPVTQVLKGIVNGEVDLLMLISHPMVMGKAIYGKQPMGSMDLQAFHRRDSADVSGLSDLRGMSVAILRGYGYGGLLNQLLAPSSNIKLSIAIDHRDAFRMLDSRQVDYVLNYLAPGVRTITELGLQNIKSNLLQKKEIYFVVSSKVDHGERFMRELEDAMNNLAP